MKRIVFVITFMLCSILNMLAQHAFETQYSIVGKTNVVKDEWRKFTINLETKTIRIDTQLGTQKYYTIEKVETSIDNDSLLAYRYVCKEGDKISHILTHYVPKNLKGNCIMFIDKMIVRGRELGSISYFTEEFKYEPNTCI